MAFWYMVASEPHLSTSQGSAGQAHTPDVESGALGVALVSHTCFYVYVYAHVYVQLSQQSNQVSDTRPLASHRTHGEQPPWEGRERVR